MGEDRTIKTAFERAWEKAEKITASDEQVQELEYGPEGAKLAARFLREENFELEPALAAHPDKVRKFVTRGAMGTFKSNIILPRNERTKRESLRSLTGLMALKKDKSRFAQVKDRIESLLANYERQRQETYGALRQEFDGVMRQALRQQVGVNTQMRIDVEAQPEFRQRWQELSARLDQEYEERLRRLKEDIDRIP